MNIIVLAWGMAMIFWSVLFLLINGNTKNFLASYVYATMSKGKLILVRIKAINGFYFRTAKVDEKEFLVFKDQSNKQQRVNVPEDYDFEEYANFKSITWDEQNNALISFSKNYIVYDSTKCENLYERSIKAPQVRNFAKSVKSGMLPLITLIAIIVVAWLAYNVYNRQDLLYQEITVLKTLIETAASKGVVN